MHKDFVMQRLKKVCITKVKNLLADFIISPQWETSLEKVCLFVGPEEFLRV